jgi:hypothetical protein
VEPAERPDRKVLPPPTPASFEEIYQDAAVKPARLACGIVKVAEMSRSNHLAGMPPDFKRRALLMALEATGTNVGEVLNDVVIRQRALQEYEEAHQKKLNQFESAYDEQNRVLQAELDKITAQFKARIQAGRDEVELRQEEFREWQRSKQQELQRYTEAAALCVPQDAAKEEEEPEKKIMTIHQRAGGAYH